MLNILSLLLLAGLFATHQFSAPIGQPVTTETTSISTPAAENQVNENARIYFSADPTATDCAKAKDNSETHFEMKGRGLTVRCFVSGTLIDKNFAIAIETHGPDQRTEKLTYNGSCLYKDLEFHHRGKYRVRLVTDGRDAEVLKYIYIE